MNSYLDNWKNKCEFSERCDSYHKNNYECANNHRLLDIQKSLISDYMNVSQCNLYEIYRRIDIKVKETKTKLELLVLPLDDGTAWRND